MMFWLSSSGSCIRRFLHAPLLQAENFRFSMNGPPPGMLHDYSHKIDLCSCGEARPPGRFPSESRRRLSATRQCLGRPILVFETPPAQSHVFPALRLQGIGPSTEAAQVARPFSSSASHARSSCRCRNRRQARLARGPRSPALPSPRRTRRGEAHGHLACAYDCLVNGSLDPPDE